jgi:hypothetical protein
MTFKLEDVKRTRQSLGANVGDAALRKGLIVLKYDSPMDKDFKDLVAERFTDWYPTLKVHYYFDIAQPGAGKVWNDLTFEDVKTLVEVPVEVE